jgi:hypothetical protein
MDGNQLCKFSKQRKERKMSYEEFLLLGEKLIRKIIECCGGTPGRVNQHNPNSKKKPRMLRNQK